MIIQIVSDVHLEFNLRDIEVDNRAELIILAGDIHRGLNGVIWAKKFKIPVLYILGNHEYYKQAHPKFIHKIRDAVKDSNVILLENESIVFNDITFHGATLWTDFNLFGTPELSGYWCQQKMNDYKYIRRYPSYSKMRPIDIFKIHVESKKWLKNSLINSITQKNVVISHHGPSIKSTLEKYRDDQVTANYVSNLEEFILEYNPNIWIHGHIHTKFDYYIGKTRIVCNPYGYPDDNLIETVKIIEI